MRRFIRYLLVTFLLVLIVAVALPFTLPLQDGKPLLNWSEFWHTDAIDQKMERLVREGKRLGRTLTDGGSDAPVTMYKWHDEQGQVHYTSEPPAERPYEAMEVDPNTNMLPSVGSGTIDRTPADADREEPAEAPGTSLDRFLPPSSQQE